MLRDLTTVPFFLLFLLFFFFFTIICSLFLPYKK